MEVFYHPDLGTFCSLKDDLSDLGGPYLEVAQMRRRDAAHCRKSPAVQPETVEEFKYTIDDRTAKLMDTIEALDRALVEAVKVDLEHRVEIESLKIKLKGNY
jgi:ribosomal protein S10